MSRLLPYNIYYENTAGEKLVLSEMPYVVTDSRLFDAKWNLSTLQRYTGEGARLYSARHSTEEKNMTVKVVADNAERLSVLLAHMSEVFDRDIVEHKPGRLWVNGQYMTCWCSARQKELSCDFTASATVTVTVLPESPVWCRERRYEMAETAEEIEEAKNYTYDYPYSYSSEIKTMAIENTGWQNCPMRITFWGAADNPAVYINGAMIGVNVSLQSGEYAVIDQMSREIYKVDAEGIRTNLFNRRIKNGFSFEWLPSGENTAYLEGTDKAEIVVIEQRSEPEWTLR